MKVAHFCYIKILFQMLCPQGQFIQKCLCFLPQLQGLVALHLLSCFGFIHCTLLLRMNEITQIAMYDTTSRFLFWILGEVA